MEGDDHREAYTAIRAGSVLSPEIVDIAEAQALCIVEGDMCGAAMRGAVAPPGSETRSCRKGTRRNLGDLVWPLIAKAIRGRDRKSRRRSCRGAGEESDGLIAPAKRSNKPAMSPQFPNKSRSALARDRFCGP